MLSDAIVQDTLGEQTPKKKLKVSSSVLSDCTNKISNVLDNSFTETFGTPFSEAYKKTNKLEEKKIGS